MPKSTRRTKAKRQVKAAKASKEHSVSELYLHGLAGIIGLGILILPIFVSLVYGGPLSVYLVIGAGFIALLIAVLIYDISLTHSHDPYNFLKVTSNKEYSFIFGFLMLISFIITITAAGIASVGELSEFFGVDVYVAIAIVDVIFLFMWVLLFYNHTRRTINFAGALKIFFVLLLIVVGAIAVFRNGINSASTSISFPAYTFAPFALAILLFLWMYGGFESVAIAYRGKDRSKVARVLIYVLFSAIVIFAVMQLLVFWNSSGINLSSIQLNPVSVFTANVLTSGLGTTFEDIIIGLSIVVILTMALTVINAANHTLGDMARDGLMPRFLINDQNLKLLITAAVPIALITIFSNIVTLVPGALFIYIPIIILSALSFASAFVFFAIGYGYHYVRTRDRARAAFGIFVGILLIALILLSPAAFLVGLAIIIAVSLLGYVLIK
ncbi:MAG: APC family permease [Candidatus Parvarchaeota archaeon]|jgi:amino acid transporter|nr:APC family permease [Candidatus Parvarchaeota archaeon]MCL5101692.1 APC family permease [Candidatus Parvarchaeota archaeon]